MEKIRGSLYAICLNMSGQNRVTIKSLAEADAAVKPNFHGIIRKVCVLGMTGEVRWYRDPEGLHIEVPKPGGEMPVVFKILVD